MPTPPEWPAKDPDETLWFGFNWTPARLGQSNIASVEYEVTAGDIQVLSSAIDRVPGSRPNQGTMHLLSGGSADTDCTIRLTATTDDDPELVIVQTVSIRVEEQ